MTAAVAGAETGHGNQPFHACGLHGIDKDTRGFREERCAFEDDSRREVDAERLDNYVNVLECVPDRVAIERIARHLIEGRILDGYACR